MSETTGPIGAGHTAAVITSSTRAAGGVYPDRSGAVIVERLRGWGFAVDDAVVVSDGEEFGAALRSALESGPSLVLTTGGTGLTPTDVTPEADRSAARPARAGCRGGDPGRGCGQGRADRDAVARPRRGSPGSPSWPTSPARAAGCATPSTCSSRSSPTRWPRSPEATTDPGADAVATPPGRSERVAGRAPRSPAGAGDRAAPAPPRRRAGVAAGPSRQRRPRPGLGADPAARRGGARVGLLPAVRPRARPGGPGRPGAAVGHRGRGPDRRSGPPLRHRPCRPAVGVGRLLARRVGDGPGPRDARRSPSPSTTPSARPDCTAWRSTSVSTTSGPSQSSTDSACATRGFASGSCTSTVSGATTARSPSRARTSPEGP